VTLRRKVLKVEKLLRFNFNYLFARSRAHGREKGAKRASIPQSIARMLPMDKASL
jgi:hypothetical protein